MKKTRILVPAVALLALGIAGATTGTVAWYSSNTKVFADGIGVQSATAQSLVISKEAATGYGTRVDHQLGTKTLNPAYNIANTGAPSFVMVDTDKVGSESTKGFIVESDGKVYAKDGDGAPTGAAIAPAAEDDSNPWATADDSALVDVTEYLKLEGQGETSKNVQLKVDAMVDSGKEIDKALRFTFWDGSAAATVTPFASGTSYSSNVGTAFAVTAAAKEVHFYLWYDGQDAVCKNANAINNPVTVKLTYSITA